MCANEEASPPPCSLDEHHYGLHMADVGPWQIVCQATDSMAGGVIGKMLGNMVTSGMLDTTMACRPEDSVQHAVIAQ